MKTAMQKFIDELELGKTYDPTGRFKGMGVIDVIIARGKELLAEEQAQNPGAPCGRPHCLAPVDIQKPSAPASLVEELGKLEVFEHDSATQYHMVDEDEMLKIISHYAPIASEPKEVVQSENSILPKGFALCSECGGNGYVLEKSGMGEEQEPSSCPDCHGKGLIAIKELGYHKVPTATKPDVREKP